MAELSTVETFDIQNRKTLYSLLIAFAIFAIILFMPTPSGLSVLGQRVLAIFALVVVLWVTEPIPLPATAFIPGIMLFLLGIANTPTEAFASYANPAVFFIIGSLIIAQGLVKSGIGKRMALGFLSRCRNSPTLLLFMLIAISSTLAMFISDHLVAAMLLPVAITIVATAKIEGKFKIALVLAIAFGCGIAGLATPSGGARNAVALSFLEEIAGAHISYLGWMKAALPVTLIMIPVIFVILRLMFPPRGINLQAAVDEIRADLMPMSKREWKALAVFLLVLALFVSTSDLVGLGTIAILGAILMFATEVLDWSEAESGVNWGVMFIYGAAITMGVALKNSGAAEWLAQGMLNAFPVGSSPIFIIMGVVLIATVLTTFISDGAASSILVPITINIALITAIEPRVMVLATAIPTAFAYITIFGTPANTIAYGSGFFNSKDLLRAGIFVEIAAMLVMFFVVKYYWSWLGLW